MVMKDKKAVPFTEVRQNLTAILDDVETSGKPVTILRRGKPAAVIISHETYEKQVVKAKPFRLAGSVRIGPGIDIDKELAKDKEERIRAWDQRTKRFRK
jgi:prevent-host-death family protein